jgi:S1-C subfamily serine protease
MNITRITSRIAFIIGASIALAPTEAAAQSRNSLDPVRVTPPAVAGCSGVSWAKVRTAEGSAHPIVTEVANSSPADASGIKEGDVILKVNGRDARDLDTWFVAAPGETVVVRIQRANKERDVNITAGRVMQLAPALYAVECQRAS